VPSSLLTQIDAQKAEQQRLQNDINRYQASRQQAEASFAADHARLSELRGQRR
jgi:septal ring factor EnvC (AmiA/AmiB activator)